MRGPEESRLNNHEWPGEPFQRKLTHDGVFKLNDCAPSDRPVGVLCRGTRRLSATNAGDEYYMSASHALTRPNH